MQIPPDPDIADPNPEKRESVARNEAGLWSRRELSSLEYLTDRGCSVTPKLLAWVGCSANGAPMGPQRLYPYHRHGEGPRRIFGNLPGSSIQGAGKDSRCFPQLVGVSSTTPLPTQSPVMLICRFRELYSFGIEPRDTRLQNLIYDPKKNRAI
ncbi:hypothetical protein DIZ76_014369 [Coccidioides immitis]|nr:hypothetical protein DIZ76_014369 [Coccidioides immitis]